MAQNSGTTRSAWRGTGGGRLRDTMAALLNFHTRWARHSAPGKDTTVPWQLWQLSQSAPHQNKRQSSLAFQQKCPDQNPRQTRKTMPRSAKHGPSSFAEDCF